MNINLQGLGWVVRLQNRGRNFGISLVKELVLGNALKKGSELYYYLTQVDDSPAILVFLDEKGLEDFEVTKIRRGKVLLKNRASTNE